MPGIILALLVVWAVFAIIGFVVHALLWVAILALVLFALTALIGVIQFLL